MRSRIFPILALVLSVGIFYVYIYPLWNGKISATKSTLSEDAHALSAANQYASQENLLTSQRDAISTTSLARLNEFLPDSVNQVGLILDLNGLVKQSGLTFTGISATQNATSSALNATDAQSSEVGSVDITVSATGTYNDFMNFLHSVENSEQLLDVQDLTVTGSETGVYTYSIRIQTYWLL